MTASRYVEYTLHCDHDECDEAFGPFGVERSRPEMRKLAKKAGWTSVASPLGPNRHFDFCPKHRPQQPTSNPGHNCRFEYCTAPAGQCSTPE